MHRNNKKKAEERYYGKPNCYIYDGGRKSDESVTLSGSCTKHSKQLYQPCKQRLL